MLLMAASSRSNWTRISASDRLDQLPAGIRQLADHEIEAARKCPDLVCARGERGVGQVCERALLANERDMLRQLRQRFADAMRKHKAENEACQDDEDNTCENHGKSLRDAACRLFLRRRVDRLYCRLHIVERLEVTAFDFIELFFAGLHGQRRRQGAAVGCEQTFRPEELCPKGFGGLAYFRHVGPALSVAQPARQLGQDQIACSEHVLGVALDRIEVAGPNLYRVPFRRLFKADAVAHQLVDALDHRIGLGQRCRCEGADLRRRGSAGLHIDLDLVFGPGHVRLGANGSRKKKAIQLGAGFLEFARALLRQPGSGLLAFESLHRAAQRVGEFTLPLLRSRKTDVDAGVSGERTQCAEMSLALRVEFGKVAPDLFVALGAVDCRQKLRAHALRIFGEFDAFRLKRRCHFREDRHNARNAIDVEEADGSANTRHQGRREKRKKHLLTQHERSRQGHRVWRVHANSTGSGSPKRNVRYRPSSAELPGLAGLNT